ncbi:putative lipid II flippase FtsW [Candidatus Woesebacteria bacterium]|nr:putative lipid II flippase FtsW [Candidatus Woesebacteria bacterium]
MKKHNKTTRKIAFPHMTSLFITTLLLSLVGLLFVFEASSVNALQNFDNSFYFLNLQVRWFVIGFAVLLAFAFFDYKKLYYVAFPFFGIVLVLLVAVLIPSIGQKIGGARRWIDLGFFALQPSEFAKLAIIMYLSSWFLHKEKSRFLPFISLVGILMFLILLQPDMGTAIIVFGLCVIMYFFSGENILYLLVLLPTAVAGFIGLIIAAPYRMQRITAFLDPSKDPQGVGYHINQILISLSNGGFLGEGFGASRQKYLFLPEAHTDSIFAIVGEEFGFVGGVLLIFLYGFLLYNLYAIYQKTSDRFGKLLIGAIFVFFGLQILTNLGGMVSLLPLTGVPLPFISYGGSHMLVSCILIGIAMNIARKAHA